VIDVFCQDRLGALHGIASALFDAGLSISLAKISTQGDRIADGFYVTDRDSGKKIEDPERLAAIKTAVLEAIGRTEPASR
jgi:[protein-PII] uridylyltransferase